MATETFSIDKRPLRDLLRQVEAGKIQLPEFQRGWVWPWPHIASLLASVSLNYPIGTVMLLEGGGDVRFKYRPIEGAAPSERAQPESLVLDGQQRLTSLYQSLAMDSPVKTQDERKRPVSGWFYVDMVKALDENEDREDAIRFIPPTRKVVNFRGEVLEDYSTRELEYQHRVFPLRSLFDNSWGDGFARHWGFEPDAMELWYSFRDGFIHSFNLYHFPVIELGKDTPRQAVCQVFEKVNTGGVTLTVFELLTATYAADEFDLRRHWNECRAAWDAPEYAILKDVSNTDFLQAVTLLATAERRRREEDAGTDEERLPRIGCKRKDMLALDLEDYRRYAPDVVAGFKAAAKFLRQQFVFDTRFLPYGTQLIPLAAILALAGQDAETAGAQEKLARWYWCGVFGELYGGTTETRFNLDLPDVVDWIRGSTQEPRTVTQAQFAASRLLTLRTRQSAAYKGIYALLLKAGAADWRTGEKAEVSVYFDEAMDIHHIFPQAWCQKNGYDRSVYNSVVNKTPLTARTNRIIGGHAPSEYLHRLAKAAETSSEGVEQRVTTHLANPALMRADDFDTFFEERRKVLQDHIAAVMGKPVVDDHIPGQRPEAAVRAAENGLNTGIPTPAEP
ncbi:GmrSD restriction endonuclease domain-containing protein [Streptomyces griseoflavus]|uniref:GmrSD restriction endonuclease domain-containing protein n=1 Tax=Streptomyces griseoflavus TaxID=35619 RepID=UPI0033D8D840